jgi:hypothetical protein
MERLGGEYAPIADKIGCSNSFHRQQSWSPIITIDTILATGNTCTVGIKKVARQLPEKDVNLLKSGAFSKVTLTLEENRGRKPMTLRKFAGGYAEKEFR